MKRKKLIHLRIENGLNQDEFGKSIDFTGQYVSLIENGKADGGYKFWHKVRVVYNISVDEIESYKVLY